MQKVFAKNELDLTMHSLNLLCFIDISAIYKWYVL